MDAERTIKRMQPTWEELAQLVKRARRRGPRWLSADELARLDRLYRVTMIHMAQVQSRIQNKALLRELSRLVGQAHSVIYVAPKRRSLRRIVDFYLNGFPRAVAKTARFHLAALALFLLGLAAGWLVAVHRPEATYALMPPGETRLPGSTTEQLTNALEAGRDLGGGFKFVFASFLLTHNTKVGFAACASGVLAGVPTVFLMVYNGAMLGAFASIHVQHGIATEMSAWILPHGITEITAVILCGGAGFVLGMAVIRPGFQTRRRALLEAGHIVLALLLGVVPMFIVAGIIESYIRQSHLSTSTRLLFALGTALFWVCYFGRPFLDAAKNVMMLPPSHMAAATDDSAP